MIYFFNLQAPIPPLNGTLVLVLLLLHKETWGKRTSRKCWMPSRSTSTIPAFAPILWYFLVVPRTCDISILFAAGDIVVSKSESPEARMLQCYKSICFKLNCTCGQQFAIPMPRIVKLSNVTMTFSISNTLLQNIWQRQNQMRLYLCVKKRFRELIWEKRWIQQKTLVKLSKFL